MGMLKSVFVCVPLSSAPWDSVLQMRFFDIWKTYLYGVQRTYWDRDWDASLSTAHRHDGRYMSFILIITKLSSEKGCLDFYETQNVCVCVCAKSSTARHIIMRHSYGLLVTKMGLQ
jgi:hypothetical protein